MTHDGRDIHFLGVWFLYEDEMQVKLDDGVEPAVGLVRRCRRSARRSIRQRLSAAPPGKRRGLFRRR